MVFKPTQFIFYNYFGKAEILKIFHRVKKKFFETIYTELSTNKLTLIELLNNMPE